MSDTDDPVAVPPTPPMGGWFTLTADAEVIKGGNASDCEDDEETAR